MVDYMQDLPAERQERQRIVAADGARVALQTVISVSAAAAAEALGTATTREGVDASGWMATTAPSAGTSWKLSLINARAPERGDTAVHAR